MGSNNSGRGVGGSMVHYAGYTPRFCKVNAKASPLITHIPDALAPSTTAAGPCPAPRSR